MNFHAGCRHLLQHADIDPIREASFYAIGQTIKDKTWVQKTAGVMAAEYLRLVWMTSRFTMEPVEPFRRYEAQQPVIVAMWHGQHFLLPFLRREYRFRVLISRHSDGEINAVAAERLGVGTVRGSGDHGSRFNVKGGVAGFKGMLESLEQGWNMALTADVPKVSRVAGRGIIKLAKSRAARSFRSAWQPVAGLCSTIGIALKSTCRSAVAGLLSAIQSAFPRMRTRLCCNRPVTHLKKRSTLRRSVLT